MKTKLCIFALATTITAACSAEPEGDDAVVIMWDDNTEDETSDEVLADDGGENAASHADMGTEDVGDQSEPDLTEMEPDLTEEVQPTGNACQVKDAPIQLANTCTFEWSSCQDGKTYAFQCNIQNVAGNVFSLCNCFENGVMDEADKIVDICGAADWAAVENIVNEECGWDLR